MNFTTIIAFAAGVTVGGISRALMTQRELRKLRREHSEKIQTTNDVQDTFYAMTNTVYREALKKLESGNVDGAKQELSGAIANFCHRFKDIEGLTEKRSRVEFEKRQVELLAKSSTMLAAALKKNPDGETVV